MTIVAIAFTDKLGRKPLLYFGLTGVMLSLIALGCAFQFADVLGDNLKWVAVGSLITYIICFACSLGPIGWILVSEVFPLRIRGAAMSLCTVANFGFNFLVVFSFSSSNPQNRRSMYLLDVWCCVTVMYILCLFLRS